MAHDIVLPGSKSRMPLIGLGTWQLADCAALATAALEAGYRHIDTARAYGNEEGVGEGVRASGVAREDIFVTTKVWHEDLAETPFARSVDASLAALKMDYVDLLLVHWPTNRGVPLAETMRALARARRLGLARNIGVANFNTAMLREAAACCTEPLAVVQAEYHPELDQSKLLEQCKRLGIAFTAYCPLGRGRVFVNETLKRIAAVKGRTVAQVVLRWFVQQNVIAIPRSSNPARIAENIRVFDFSLTPEEILQIGDLRHAVGRIVSPPFSPAWD